MLIRQVQFQLLRILFFQFDLLLFRKLDRQVVGKRPFEKCCNCGDVSHFYNIRYFPRINEIMQDNKEHVDAEVTLFQKILRILFMPTNHKQKIKVLRTKMFLLKISLKFSLMMVLKSQSPKESSRKKLKIQLCVKLFIRRILLLTQWMQ